MNHCGTKPLETERLLLRRYVREDAAAIYKNWASDPQVTKFLMWQPHASPEVSRRVMEDTLTQYANDAYYRWAIVLKSHGAAPIGDIAVVHMDEKISMVHIGYCIGSRWWNKGYMSEALNAVISFFFREVKAKRVESQHHPDNIGSGRVMEKCGLAFERIVKDGDRSNKGIADACVHALSAERYFASRG